MMRKRYSEKETRVNGACLGGCAAAAAKILTRSACNLILENGFSDLEGDFIRHESFIPRLWANTFRRGLFAQDIPSAVKPRETGFSIEAMCKELDAPLKGKVVIVRVENDQRIPPIAHNRNLAVATQISSSVYPIVFRSSTSDPHFDRFFSYPEARRSLIHVFKTSLGPMQIGTCEYPQRQYRLLKILGVAAVIVAVIFALWKKG